MKRIIVIKAIYLLFISQVIHCGLLLAANKPNIVFILSDDQGYGDLSCMGATDLKTPNIDTLAAEGMKFTSFYTYQRCSPARMSFMTGTMAHRLDSVKVIYKRDRMGINPSEITIPELLKKEGYKSALVGKWHLGDWEPFHPLNHGFDYFYGFLNIGTEKKNTYVLLENRTILKSPTKKTIGHAKGMVNAALNFMKQNKQQPFFLYYADPTPHTPCVPSKEFVGTSKRGIYGDVIHELDWSVGQLLKGIDDLGLKENTLVIFTSDNGAVVNTPGLGSGGHLRGGKWTNFEGGIRVPFLARWPGKIPANSCNEQIINIMDMLPTFCNIAGAHTPTDRFLDGKNILPYLQVQKLSSPLHNSFVVPTSTIRHGKWKLYVKAQNPGGGKGTKKENIPSATAGSLFNLEDDLGEKTNVARQHPEICQQLHKKMNSFLKELKKTTRPLGRITSPEADALKVK
ncbi:MAG: sulfatase-like hydrolase/transferase [Lentisphaeraceae bacterium]|nr:sulfatase-like hydrolase/transferase [Lentisphaeraceae bacterium]